MNKTILETLEKTDLFSHLDPSKLKKMVEFCSIKKYDENTIVFLEDDTPKAFLVVVTGRVKVYKTDLKANEILLHQFKKYEMIAEMPLFAEINYPASACFETEGSLLHIDFKRFKEAFFTDAEVAFGFIYSLTKKMKAMNHLINQHMVLDATARVAQYLYEHEDSLSLVKQKDIANTLHIQAETLSRLLKKLLTMGFIQKKTLHYEIVNHQGLKALFSLEEF